jgi:predicted transcriptional regulator of viral defense system
VAQSTRRMIHSPHRVAQNFHIIEVMSDTIERVRPDREGLYALATDQAGHFTTRQAHQYGFRDPLLSHYTLQGTLRRAHPGVYRWRDFPPTPREEVVAAWLALGGTGVVVSHETALDLHDLTTLIPDSIHLTVPRTRRHPPRLSGVQVHTTTRAFGPTDTVRRAGVVVSSPTRALVDAAEANVAEEQVRAGVQQALDRGLTTARLLRTTAAGRSRRVKAVIDRALAVASVSAA